MKTRIEEIDELERELQKRMAWTPSWLKDEIRQFVSLEIEKHDLLKK